MTTFTYIRDIPNGPNNPSADQPNMQINTNSTDDLLAVDHTSFNVLNGGQHKQITFNNKNVPAAQTDPQSTLYTNSGTASSVSQLLYKNQNGTFQISAIRAWAFCNSGGIVATQSVNVDSVVRNSAGNYTVTLTANAVSSVNYAVLVSCGLGAGPVFLVNAYTITSATTFDINFSTFVVPLDPTTFSFQVLQI